MLKPSQRSLWIEFLKYNTLCQHHFNSIDVITCYLVTRLTIYLKSNVDKPVPKQTNEL